MDKQAIFPSLSRPEYMDKQAIFPSLHGQGQRVSVYATGVGLYDITIGFKLTYLVCVPACVCFFYLSPPTRDHCTEFTSNVF